MVPVNSLSNDAPLKNIDDWDDFLSGRYKEGKNEDEFRNYDAQADPGVAEFYRLNHENQTVDYTLGKEDQYFGLDKGQKTIWEAAEFLVPFVFSTNGRLPYLKQIEELSGTPVDPFPGRVKQGVGIGLLGGAFGGDSCKNRVDDLPAVIRYDRSRGSVDC